VLGDNYFSRSEEAVDDRDLRPLRCIAAVGSEPGRRGRSRAGFRCALAGNWRDRLLFCENAEVSVPFDTRAAK